MLFRTIFRVKSWNNPNAVQNLCSQWQISSIQWFTVQYISSRLFSRVWCHLSYYLFMWEHSIIVQYIFSRLFSRTWRHLIPLLVYYLFMWEHSIIVQHIFSRWFSRTWRHLIPLLVYVRAFYRVKSWNNPNAVQNSCSQWQISKFRVANDIWAMTTEYKKCRKMTMTSEYTSEHKKCRM
jgi:hypothetical protein